MDVNKIVESDIKKEKEFYAHINLFKLLLTAELSNKDYDYFCLMGGFKRLRVLEKDIIDKNISLCGTCEFDNNRGKELFEFYFRMFDLKQQLSKVTHSKSTVLKKALKEFEMIDKYYQGECAKAKIVSENSHITDLDTVTWLKENLPEELICKIERYYGNDSGMQDDEKVNHVKKIGERK